MLRVGFEPMIQCLKMFRALHRCATVFGCKNVQIRDSEQEVLEAARAQTG
jgi:hypothetical protein